MKIRHDALVASTGTTILVPYPWSQTTAPHLKIGYPQISSAGTQSSNEMQWLDKNERLPGTALLMARMTCERLHERSCSKFGQHNHANVINTCDTGTWGRLLFFCSSFLPIISMAMSQARLGNPMLYLVSSAHCYSLDLKPLNSLRLSEAYTYAEVN